MSTSHPLLARLGRVVAVALCVALVPTAARADDGSTTPTISFDSSAVQGYVGTSVALTGTLAGATDTSSVLLQQRSGDGWTDLSQTPTVTDGTFTTSVTATTSAVTVHAELVDGGTVLATSGDVVVTGRRASSTLRLSMPSSVVDYHSVLAKVSWTTIDGRRPTGRVIVQLKHVGSKTYKNYTAFTVSNGVGSKRLVPRWDGWFRLRFTGSDALTAATSATRSMDNRPPGSVVHLPKGSARPTVTLPAQPRATRVAADATVSKLSDAVWKSMKGRTWHSGCPVGRSSLRIVRVSYWAFDGYVRRGEIVVNKSVATSTKKVFQDLFAHRTPIRSMYREDRFGWSTSLHGANDLTSMRADNTSGFNCRREVGWTSRRSPHSYGTAIDVNTWENPFRSHSGYEPNASWAKRSKPASVTWRGAGDPVVKIFAKHGFHWLGTADLQHFQH